MPIKLGKRHFAVEEQEGAMAPTERVEETSRCRKEM
jgi:hypothetical protein